MISLIHGERQELRIGETKNRGNWAASLSVVFGIPGQSHFFAPWVEKTVGLVV
jgi:hypothetical protein